MKKNIFKLRGKIIKFKENEKHVLVSIILSD